MPKQAKRGGAHSARKVRRAQSTKASGGPELPPALAIFAWLLNPGQREAMRRRFIDGKGGTMERSVWKFAYSRPPAPEHEIVGWRYMTVEQYAQGEGNKPGPKFLNLPPGAVDHSGRKDTGARISCESLGLKLHQAAWALVQDPEYVDGLHRRIDDGKAPAMERLLWEIVEQHSRKPEMWRPRKVFCFLSEHPPWLMDPLAERERIMIEERKAQDELEARAREEARDKEAARPAAAPDDPSDSDGLEIYSRE